MMRYSKAVLIFFVAFILQATVLNIFDFFGATPNLILCLVIIFSFLYDEKNYGLVLGVVFGLLMDICYMQYAGISALGYFLIALAVIFVRELLNRENIITILLITTIVTPLFNIFTWCVYAILGSNQSFIYMLKFQPVFIIYNLLIVTIIYLLMIRKLIKHRKDRYYS